MGGISNGAWVLITSRTMSESSRCHPWQYTISKHALVSDLNPVNNTESPTAHKAKQCPSLIFILVVRIVVMGVVMKKF